jgi:hypothetical protein
MENDDTGKHQGDRADELAPSDALAIKTDNQANAANQRTHKTRNRNQSASQRRWSLGDHWSRASKGKKFKWIVEGFGVLLLTLTVISYYYGNYLTKHNFSIEHRPRLEFFREPALIGQFVCNVDDTSIRFRTGEMYVWVKNTKTGDAPNAFVAGPQLQLIPDPKIGIPGLDTRSSCHRRYVWAES